MHLDIVVGPGHDYTAGDTPVQHRILSYKYNVKFVVCNFRLDVIIIRKAKEKKLKKKKEKKS